MRTGLLILGAAMAVAGLLILLLVPDTIGDATIIDLRGARETVTAGTVVERHAYGTQWPDYVGNSMLLIGLVVVAAGLGMHGRRPA